MTAEVSKNKSLYAALAVTRLGLGAQPGEIAAVSTDPQAWLMNQITAQGAAPYRPDMPTSAARFTQFAALRASRRMRAAEAARDGKPAPDPVTEIGALIRQDAGLDFLSRIEFAAATKSGFAERWALFWSNHFTVSALKPQAATLIGPFEQEAIRPHVFGRFEDMLVASTTHPAMLLYLDQAQSIGPNSRAAAFFARRGGGNGVPRGLNENLAREILELHTVGVEADYSQADVTEFARALTGWSLAGPNMPDREGQFLFRANAHEPGVRTLLGRRYAENGFFQAREVLHDLAANPHTAQHLATKIARHFVSDTPPESLVTQLRAAYLSTGGNLGEVARTLVLARETWDPEPAKFKTPYEFLVSSARLGGGFGVRPGRLGPTLAALGQRPFAAPSPKGWPDEASAWADGDALVKRMSWSEAFAARTYGAFATDARDPLTLADAALGPRLSPAAAQAISRAETRTEGLAILLMSPEFLRR
ncbi:MAG: DUF1800 family protein [Alphaproteobacteria bacterium]|nr:DUF1800 family protein [Alphaproteobacteria bacterium]